MEGSPWTPLLIFMHMDVFLCNKCTKVYWLKKNSGMDKKNFCPWKWWCNAQKIPQCGHFCDATMI